MNGDQFEQLDDRRVYGTDLSWRRTSDWLSRGQELTVGVQARADDIGKVGLYRTVARERFETVREDSVRQSSYSVYASLDTRWTDFVRTTLGIRADHFDFDLVAALPAGRLRTVSKSSKRFSTSGFTSSCGTWHCVQK